MYVFCDEWRKCYTLICNALDLDLYSITAVAADLAPLRLFPKQREFRFFFGIGWCVGKLRQALLCLLACLLVSSSSSWKIRLSIERPL